MVVRVASCALRNAYGRIEGQGVRLVDAPPARLAPAVTGAMSRPTSRAFRNTSDSLASVRQLAAPRRAAPDQTLEIQAPFR